MPSSGIISVAGKNLNEISESDRGFLRNKYLGFVFQFHHLLGEFTAEENVAMPLLIRRHPSADAIEKARILLERVGLASRARHRPSELSGGERQRAAVARALITRPTCVLADEPTGNLDQETADRVFELLMGLTRETGIAALVATHNPQLAARTDGMLTLKNGILEVF